MAKIRNIVLDIGNVLAAFRWQGVFTERLKLSGEDFEKVADATTRGPMWPELDRGVLSDEEIITACVARAPEYKTVIRELFRHLNEMCTDYDYAQTWIRSLKEQGFGVYILSSFGKTSFDGCLANGQLAFLPLTDGAVLSYQVKHVKPEPEIYEALLTRYALKAEECLFFDDVAANVEGARAVGMQAEVFTGCADACAKIDAYR